MVSFRPLGNTKERAFQTIVTLENNDVTVLVDTGWDEHLSTETLQDLIDVIPQIDLILLTHATVGHIGAFCYLRHRYPQFRAIPAYATLPVIRMSQMVTLELYQNAGLCGPFDSDEAMRTQDVEILWSEVQNVKYSQPLKLHSSPKVEGITITAYNGGHSLGGSLWKIHDNIDSIVVALDWNHARDAHLNGAFLEPKTGTVVGDLRKPSLLITTSTVSSGQPLTKARRNFLDNIDLALKRGGPVLVPTSAGSRVLELILILEKHMSTKHSSVPLIYCNQFGKQALTQASSMLEWMVSSIIGDWQVQNESPFDTSHVKFVNDIQTIRAKWPDGPKIILAAGESLESGPSKELFLDLIAEDATASVIINEICPPETLGHELMAHTKSNDFAQLNIKLPQITFNVRKPLSGEALENYIKRQESERERASMTAAQERRNQQLIDTSAQAEDESSDSEDENEELGDTLISGSNILLYGKNVYDYQFPLDPETKVTTANCMFPFGSKRRRADDYGEYIPSGLFNDKPPKEESVATANAATTGASSAASSADNDEDDIDMSGTNSASTDQRKKSSRDNFGELETPVELVKSVRKNVRVVCNLAISDMNGITNAKSLLMVIKQVQPLRVIVLPGNQEVCDYLQKQCQVFAVGDKSVEFPRTNFSVDVRLDASIKLDWHDLIGGFSVSRVSGTLEFDPHDRIKKSGAVLVSSTGDSVKAQAESSVSKRPIAIGDLRLTSLRKVLNDMGMKADFQSQGVLVCNEKVLVKKAANDTYILQGGIDEDYYEVRKAIRQFVTTI